MRRCIGLVVLSCALSVGCGGWLGPDFHPISGSPASSGIVYVYRPAHFMGGGLAMTVTADGILLGFMFNGGYIPYRVRPGTHTFYAGKSDVHVNVDVGAGEVHFVEYRTRLGIVSLVEVPRDEAMNAIEGCSLLPGGYDGRDRIAADSVAVVEEPPHITFGTDFDPTHAKDVQQGQEKVQIEAWFGRPPEVHKFKPNEHGCVENWSYTFANTVDGKNHARALNVLFDVSGKVCVAHYSEN